MRKTVLVSDDSGKEYEPTFEKRARGLVKKGRARWIGENRICLASPPDHDFRKEPDMSESVKIEPAPTVEYVLSQIEKLSEEPAYIRDNIVPNMPSPPDFHNANRPPGLQEKVNLESLAVGTLY